MSLEIFDGLNKVRMILSDPERWTQGRLRQHRPLQDSGYCYCLLGGVFKAVGHDFLGFNMPIEAQILKNKISHVIEDEIQKKRGHYVTIAAWNDHPKRTHSEVLEILDKSIETARKML
jgi:hypothetical protein